jgi:hypothetical protein
MALRSSVVNPTGEPYAIRQASEQSRLWNICYLAQGTSLSLPSTDKVRTKGNDGPTTVPDIPSTATTNRRLLHDHNPKSIHRLCAHQPRLGHPLDALEEH